MSDKAYNHFVGRRVVILTRELSSISEEGDERLIATINFKGYFIDSDNNFVFLGDEDEIVQRAVPIHDIKCIVDAEYQDLENEVQDIFHNKPEREDMN